MEAENSLLLEVEAYVSNFITEQVPKEFAFHDIQHTLNVVNAVQEMGKYQGLTIQEIEWLQLAAWFHDTGYDKGGQDHETRSARYAREFLKGLGYPEESLNQVVNCIMATRMPHEPKTILEKVMCDADLSHLGKKIYWDRCSRVRQELTLTKGMTMSDPEWIDFELSFIQHHCFHTSVAHELYGKRKKKHIKQLRKQKARFNPTEVLSVEDIAKRKKKTVKRPSLSNVITSNVPNSQHLKQLNLGRGVETMYRTTYRTHVNLSSIADNKANIMLSINAIIISIVVSTLVPRFPENSKLILPTVILLAVCLVSVVFATLSTRPKITEGRFSREDIKNKRSNLLFFGNFYNMKLEDFQWGMTEMIKDADFLYSSMTRDIYFLGIVLAKKYRFLSICYNVFMYGLIASVLAFAVAFLS